MQAEPSPAIMIDTARWEREARVEGREAWNLVLTAINVFTGVLVAITALH